MFLGLKTMCSFSQQAIEKSESSFVVKEYVQTKAISRRLQILLSLREEVKDFLISAFRSNDDDLTRSVYPFKVSSMNGTRTYSLLSF